MKIMHVIADMPGGTDEVRKITSKNEPITKAVHVICSPLPTTMQRISGNLGAWNTSIITSLAAEGSNIIAPLALKPFVTSKYINVITVYENTKDVEKAPVGKKAELL